MWVHTKKSQEKINPEAALSYLKEGNIRFRDNLKLHRNFLQQLNLTSDGQFPFAVILSCMDSRTSAELIFDQGLGDILSIRIAGNILNDDVLGSMEYACSIAGSRLIVVLGHTKCGAIISACNDLEMGHFTNLLQKVKPAILDEKQTATERNGDNIAFVNRVSEFHIHRTIQEIRRRSEILSDLEKKRKIRITGGLYNIETGEVVFYDTVVYE